LAPESFSLEPITATSQVQSRHVIVFMGEPGVATNWVEFHGGISVPTQWGAKTLFYDNADRDVIVQNFTGQPNTTVDTAGGTRAPTDSNRGVDGWEYPGTSRALSRAIAAAGTAIRNSENPAREQFILFVGDHGGTGFDAAPFRTNVNSREKIFLPERLKIVGGEDVLYRQLSRDPNTTPLVKLNVEPAAGGNRRAAAIGFGLQELQTTGPYRLRLIHPESGLTVELDAWTRVELDWDEDSRIDTSSREFVGLAFPISETLLFQFLGKELLVEMENASGEDLVVTGLRLDYGNSPRTSFRIPPPRISNPRVVNGGLEFELEALQFERYLVEKSVDLQLWAPVLTNTPSREISTIRAQGTGILQGNAAFRVRWEDPAP
jgi:hypothetical protein